jgi:hypothetical protein
MNEKMDEWMNGWMKRWMDAHAVRYLRWWATAVGIAPSEGLWLTLMLRGIHRTPRGAYRSSRCCQSHRWLQWLHCSGDRSQYWGIQRWSRSVLHDVPVVGCMRKHSYLRCRPRCPLLCMHCRMHIEQLSHCSHWCWCDRLFIGILSIPQGRYTSDPFMIPIHLTSIILIFLL